MSKRVLEAMVVGLCIPGVIGAILGAIYRYGRADNGGHDGNEMETFGSYSGLCLDAAILGVLAATAFTLRKRPAWPSASRLFWGGGVCMLFFVGPMPGFQLGQSLENDAQGFLLMLSIGCIGLAIVGATMVVLAVLRMAEDGSPNSVKRCQHCGPPVVGDPETCRWCGADVK
jgi:hypothetical protein